MPSTKVFAAFLAALAVPMVNAGPCKPKPVTTTDAALPGVTTSGTVTALTSGTETGTATTETSAATTTEAACSQYTPFELQPADCGKKGNAPNCADKIIGTPSPSVDWTECGNTCGKTLGCKSFSVKGRTCTLYKTLVEELGWTASEGADSSEFYDLELCFTCAEESSATSGIETATGVQTTETAAGTETTETAAGVETTETAAGTETTETAAGTETTETAAGVETTETAAGTETTETAAGTETTGAVTETSAAPNTDTAETATSTEAISESAATTTEAASTTADACTASYTAIDSAPTESCAVEGRSRNDPSIASFSGIKSVDECAAKCANYVNEVNADEVCNTFSYQDGSRWCTLYTASVEELDVSISECLPNTLCQVDGFFYDLHVCYAKCDGGAAPTTTDAATTDAATTDAATTDAATTDAATTDAATTDAATTDAATTTEAATTAEAAPVCTNYIPKPNRPSTCGQQGKVSCRSSQKLGQPTWAASADKCGKICGTTEGCKTFSFKYNGSQCQLYSSALDQLTFTPCNTGVKFYDLEKCYTCQSEETPAPPATCSKYVADFENCGSNTYCGTRGSICEEELIPNAGDASCLENCAKSCINFGAECVYFSYKPANPWGNAKCKLYKSGKITKNRNSITKFYQQPCFKCQDRLVL